MGGSVGTRHSPVTGEYILNPARFLGLAPASLPAAPVVTRAAPPNVVSPVSDYPGNHSRVVLLRIDSDESPVRGRDDPGYLYRRVVDAPADLPSAGFERSRSGIAWHAQTVAKAAGRTTKQFGQLCLSQERPEALGELVGEFIRRPRGFVFHGFTLAVPLGGDQGNPSLPVPAMVNPTEPAGTSVAPIGSNACQPGRGAEPDPQRADGCSDAASAWICGRRWRRPPGRRDRPPRAGRRLRASGRGSAGS